MKKHIIILTLLLTTLNYSQNKATKSNNILKTTTELIKANNEVLLKDVKSEFYNNYKRKVDSLNREILYYKVKEDYYASALSEQSSKYIFISSGILAILAIISFGIFKVELFRLKNFTRKKVNKQTKVFDDFKIDFNNLKISSLLTQANVFASIGVHFRKEGDLILSFSYHLDSAEFNVNYRNLLSIKNGKKIKTKHCETVLSNISIANDIIDEIILEETLKLEMKKKSKRLLKSLDRIYTVESKTVKNKISELRMKLTDYIA
jgi:hypothetical protein